MIRTSFSFLMLCTCLFVASKLIHESIAAEKPRSTTARKITHSFSGPYIAAFDLHETDATCGLELPDEGKATGEALKNNLDATAAKQTDTSTSPEEDLEDLEIRLQRRVADMRRNRMRKGGQ